MRLCEHARDEERQRKSEVLQESRPNLLEYRVVESTACLRVKTAEEGNLAMFKRNILNIAGLVK